MNTRDKEERRDREAGLVTVEDTQRAHQQAIVLPGTEGRALQPSCSLNNFVHDGRSSASGRERGECGQEMRSL